MVFETLCDHDDWEATAVLLWSALRAHRDAWRLHTSEPVVFASGHGLASWSLLRRYRKGHASAGAPGTRDDALALWPFWCRQARVAMLDGSGNTRARDARYHGYCRFREVAAIVVDYGSCMFTAGYAALWVFALCPFGLLTGP